MCHCYTAFMTLLLCYQATNTKSPTQLHPVTMNMNVSQLSCSRAICVVTCSSVLCCCCDSLKACLRVWHAVVSMFCAGCNFCLEFVVYGAGLTLTVVARLSKQAQSSMSSAASKAQPAESQQDLAEVQVSHYCTFLLPFLLLYAVSAVTLTLTPLHAPQSFSCCANVLCWLPLALPC